MTFVTADCEMTVHVYIEMRELAAGEGPEMMSYSDDLSLTVIPTDSATTGDQLYACANFVEKAAGGSMAKDASVNVESEIGINSR